MTLLRLKPTGDEALKPFGYDLFEGIPSTFAPVSDIQVPVDYIVGPGDTLVVQLYGNEPSNLRTDGGARRPHQFPEDRAHHGQRHDFRCRAQAIEHESRNSSSAPASA